VPREGSGGEAGFSDEPSTHCVMDINHPRGVAAVAPLADRGCSEFSSFAFTTSADGSEWYQPLYFAGKD